MGCETIVAAGDGDGKCGHERCRRSHNRRCSRNSISAIAGDTLTAAVGVLSVAAVRVEAVRGGSAAVAGGANNYEVCSSNLRYKYLHDKHFLKFPNLIQCIVLPSFLL